MLLRHAAPMLHVLALLAVHPAGPALAETIVTPSRVVAVTVFPRGAEVVRELRLAAPAGRHEVVVPDLPAGTSPDLLRIAGAEGVRIGARALRSDRLPPRPDLAPDPQRLQAEAAVEEAEAARLAAEAAVAVPRARIEAAEARIAFLRGAAGPLPAGTTAEGLRALAAAIGAEVEAARAEATAAAALVPALERAAEAARRAEARAQAALAALPPEPEPAYALTVAVELAAAGEQVLQITHFVGDAGWRPVYELDLRREGTGAEAASGAVRLARGAYVSQASGEDWRGVALTLSTAAPADRAEPGQLFPDLRSLAPRPEDLARSLGEAALAEAPLAEPVMAAEAEVALAEAEGPAVLYRYPGRVDVAAGVSDLRLMLDTLTLPARVEARAVPRVDRTAFAMTHIVNPAGEPLLPGTAFLSREGVVVGGTWLEGAPAGGEIEVPFGAIDAIRLERSMPVNAQGARGLIVSSTERVEETVLTLRNTGAEGWPLRLIDQVPYAEDEAIGITFSADPPPAEVDAGGERGLLAWTLPLGPGETRQVRLVTRLRWPEGRELR
jgi:uncharacterized protein (TIGR02231 family)